MVSFDNFSFRYGTGGPLALDSITFSVREGEILFIGGPSGSGKSTLCSAIAGHIPFKIRGQMRGKVEVGSKDIWKHTERELVGKVGYVFQNADEQIVTFSVYDEIAFAVENLGLSSEEIHARVTRAAAQLGITGILNRNVARLSGGEKQKVVIASNLVMDQDVLILDEPLAFLDLESQHALVKTIDSIHQQRPGLVVVIVEHRFSPFKEIVDKIVILGSDGKIAFLGDKEEYATFAAGKKIVRDIQDFPDIPAFIAAELKGCETTPPTSPPRPESESLVELERVSFQYATGTPLLTDFSLNVRRGDFLGILGANGSGKTTLLYLIMGILKPDAGTIRFQGTPYETLAPAQLFPRIGFIFQNPETQIFEDTVADELLFGPRNFVKGFASMNEQDQRKAIDTYISLVHDERTPNDILAIKNPFLLSWGQKRRLNIGSVFSYDPDLIILDEPFIGQDLAVSEEIIRFLDEARACGKAVVIVTHDIDLLRGHCTSYVQLGRASTPEKVPTRRGAGTPTGTGGSSHRGAHKRKGRGSTSKLGAFLKASMNPSDELERKTILNPSSKLISLAALTLVVLLERSLFLLGCIYIVALATCLFSARESGGILKQLRWIVLLVLIYVPLNTIFDASVRPGDEVLFFLYPPFFPIRRIAVYYSIRIGALMMILFTTSIAFTRTTPIKDFLYSLIQARLPYRAAFALMVGLRYMPIIHDEARTIEIAQRVRGLGLHKRMGLKKAFKMITHRISTLLVSVLRKTRITAMAMETRAFGFKKTRTNLYHVAWRPIDTIWVMACCCVALMFVLRAAGVIVFGIPSLLSLASGLLFP